MIEASDLMERSAIPGSTSARYLRMGMPSLRQLSTIEKMAAILGPASLLPKCSQLRRPIAMGRIEFSTCLPPGGQQTAIRKQAFPCASWEHPSPLGKVAASQPRNTRVRARCRSVKYRQPFASKGP